MAKNQNFPFVVRQAAVSATAVAEEVENTLQLQKPVGFRRPNGWWSRPVLLSISASSHEAEKKKKSGVTTAVTFRYEGGTVVKVHLEGGWNHPVTREYEGECWTVIGVVVKYYVRDSATYRRLGDEKTVAVFEGEELVAIKELHPWWHHPHVTKPRDQFGLTIG